jgi:hypothetical protein
LSHAKKGEKSVDFALCAKNEEALAKAIKAAKSGGMAAKGAFVVSSGA